MRGKTIGLRLDNSLYARLPKKDKSEAIRNVLRMFYNKELVQKTEISIIQQKHDVLQVKNDMLQERITELNNDNTRLQTDLNRYLLEISKRDKEIDFLKNRYLPSPGSHWWQFWKK